MNVQEQVLEEIMNSDKKLTPKDLAEETGLNVKQIYMAIVGLKSRGFIHIERDKSKVGYKHPPRGKKIRVWMRESQIPRAIKLINKKNDK